MINYRFGHFFKRLLPWIVTIGIFAYLFHQIAVSEVLEAATHVNLWLFIPVIIIGFLLYFLWDVLLYTLVFGDVGIQVTYREMIPIRGAAHLLTIINHFAGTGGVALLMNRWKNIPISQAGSVVVFKLFIEYYGILALCLITAFHIPGVDLKLLFSNAAEGDLVRMIIISWIIYALVLIFFNYFYLTQMALKRLKTVRF